MEKSTLLDEISSLHIKLDSQVSLIMLAVSTKMVGYSLIAFTLIMSEILHI